MGPSSLLDSRVKIIMDDVTCDFLNNIGRTEDIRFSSDNKKLAIAGFLENCILLMDIDIHYSNQKPVVNIIKCIKIISKHFKEPHGVDFIDNDYLVVANRNGNISLFDIRNLPSNSTCVELRPIKVIKYVRPFRRINSPGSVCILNSNDDEIDILVCNNYSHKISRHVIPLKSRFKFVKNSIFLEKGLNIPDGIAINKDKSRLAISDHNTNRVLIFNLMKGISPRSEYIGELKDAGYPHGVRFSDDSKKIFIADAGAPYINVYQSKNGDWSGNSYPSKKLICMTGDDFLKWHTNPQEGGPKGLDISADGSLLAISTHAVPLDLFYVKEIFSF
jgi:DNA-binding beta-propeller fold protein YncE